MIDSTALPQIIRNEDELDEFMTRPSPELVSFVAKVRSPLLVLGAGGKMGPSLAVRARRAAELAGHSLRVIAVSRFSDDRSRRWLNDRGVETISADLFDRRSVAELPDAENIIYLVGLKFGTAQNPARTWAINTLVPAYVSERFPKSRIVALSTGNVYPLVPATSSGAIESDPLVPLGEYANAAVARERLFEFFSQQNEAPVALIRLNYAVDLRYGVLLDIAQNVYAEKPIDLATGSLNCIWQGDANDMIIRSLDLAVSPPRPLNLTGRAKLSVRQLAEEFGRLFDKPVQFRGTGSETALLSNAAEACRLLGEPPTPLPAVMRWTAHWLRNGGRTFGKPTHFEVRDGSF